MATIGEAREPPPALYSVAFDLGTVGYEVAEHFVTGDAPRYRLVGERGDDGVWDAEPVGSAPFTTRLVVHRPVDVQAANGTVVLEWLNVTGGFDIPAVWMATHRHLVRAGCTWVGVSVQEVGIRGGGGVTEGLSLRDTAPERYGDLEHPGDAHAFGLFSEVARALRAGLPALHGIPVDTLLAAGASQSAMYLTTYVNAVDPEAQAVDGVLLQGRAGAGVPIEGWDPSSIRFRDGDDPAIRARRLHGRDRIRDDVRVPVLVVQSETDVLGTLAYLPARQDDGERFRLWEVAGAAHCDTYFLHASPHDTGRLPVAELASLLARTDLGEGTRPMNCGPQMHYVLQRAVAALDEWARHGTPPAPADRLVVDDAGRLVIDAVGNARGGVRTPWVDAPVHRLSGLGQSGPLLELMGTSEALTAGELADRWPGGRAEHAAAFADATRVAAAAGVVLADDVEEIVSLGSRAWPGGEPT
jgi:hypothetical protein